MTPEIIWNTPEHLSFEKPNKQHAFKNKTRALCGRFEYNEPSDIPKEEFNEEKACRNCLRMVKNKASN